MPSPKHIQAAEKSTHALFPLIIRKMWPNCNLFRNGGLFLKNRNHILCFFIALLLLLTACSNATPAITQPTEPAATTTPETTQPPQQTRTVLQSMTTDVIVGDMTISNRTDQIYDDRGLLCEIVNYSGDAEVSRTSVENDEHGEVLRQIAVSNGITNLTESENTYDQAGNLIKKVDTVSTDGTVTGIREYNYNTDHKHTSCTFTTLGDPNQITTITYEYDSQGREILEVQKNGDSIILQTETHYGENGQPVKFIYRNSDGEITSYSEITYGENGTEKQMTYAPDGTPSPSYTVTTRNEHGNPVTQETYNGDALAMRITFTYITVPAFT